MKRERNIFGALLVVFVLLSSDVVARWQVAFGACRNGQTVQRDDLAPL
jgi:hypothetical protein